MKVEWDYTELASSYDRRADYSEKLLDDIVCIAELSPGTRVADVGAGTGKLTVPLLNRGLIVSAVEPNDAMRQFGISNTQGQSVVWSEGTGEATGLESRGFAAVMFGSSFNVVDQAATLAEAARVLQPGGWFVCMWNHRDLNDPLQQRIEALIRGELPEYAYGARRESPVAVIEATGLFGPVHALEGRLLASISKDDFIEAWRSHATLARQAGPKFNRIVGLIGEEVHDDPLSIPYVTRAWAAKLKG